jgi:DNA sulfur modification protein DndB
MTQTLIPNVLSRSAGTSKYYFGSIRSSMLRGLTYVPLNEPNPKPCAFLTERTGGYQRWGSVTRMRLFQNYLRQHPTEFVPPLLLSAPSWTFEAQPGNPDVGTLKVFEAASIVDGQHRAGGFIAAFEEDEIDRNVDFICYVGLSPDEEQALFVDINTTQKGVDKGLGAYLKGGEGVDIAEGLNVSSDSPFKGRIARQKPSKSQLFKLHSFIGGIQKTFSHGRLANLSVDQRVEALTNYWTIIADVFSEVWDADLAILDDPAGGRSKMESKILELTGFLTWSYLGPQILGEAFIDSHGFNWQRVRSRIEACENFDWRKHGQYEGRTGSAGAQHLKGELERMLPPLETQSIEDDSEE